MPLRGLRARLLPAALFAVALALPTTPVAAGAAARAPRVDLRALATAKSFDHFIVKFRAGSAPAAAPSAVGDALARAAGRAKSELQAAHAARGGGKLAQPWSLRAERRLGVGADLFASSARLGPAQVRALLQQLAADPDVEYVAIDKVLRATLVPNDTSYAQEWGLNDADAGIRADKAWDLGNGSGVVVAVIDTGYTDHSDLLANILPGYDFITDVTRANDGDGRDTDAHDPGDWSPGKNSSWHGTHVSGTIAAVTNNAKGIAGAAWGAKILPVRVLGVGGGSSSDIDDAITWASGGSVPGAPANANPAEVINLSIGGGGGCSAADQAAIDGAVGRGTLVVVAAGNENLDASGGSLATCGNVVVVGAHTSSSARSSFSNYGDVVDLSAPGSSIYSTLNSGTTVPAAESYASYQGTSMSTPHVASAAALTQAYRVARGLAPYTPAQLEAQMKSTAYAMAQGCTGSGAGVVDARTLLDTADGAFKLLADGVAQSGLSASTGGGLRYAMVAPTTRAQGLTFTTSGGSGDADLYVKFGSAPTTSSYDCRSNLGGNGESCNIASAQAGTYYVLLQAASSFSGVSLTGAASGNRKPVAAFGNGSSGLTASFTDASTDADGGVTSRNWNFGDGSSSTTANPSHTYGMAGAYTVQLTAKDASSASNCLIRQVSVNPAPVALANGVAVTGIAAKIGAQLPYTLSVPAGASNLSFATSGGTGDADLYIRFGAPPTLSTYDCISGSPTTDESCTLPSATAGTWYVMVNAFSDISGVSLVGSYTGGTGNTPPTANFSFTTSALTASFTDASTDAGGSIASRAWNFGDGTSSTLANPSHTYASAGTYAVQLTVTDDGGLTNSVTKQVTVSGGGGIPNMRVSDMSITEGNSGPKKLNFVVSLSAASSSAVTFDVATQNNSAIAGSDYVAVSQTGVTIAAGLTSKTVSVTINGDTAVEPDEAFIFNISNAVGANITVGSVWGNILNDDGGSTPNMWVSDMSVTEGNSGTKTLNYVVNLSAASGSAITFDAATSNNTAMAGSDYVAVSQTGVTIPAGQTSKTISVTINGDTAVEPDEAFIFNISNAHGANITVGSVWGNILNDDGGSTPNMWVGDMSITEGNSGTKTLNYVVNLSAASSSAITFDAATTNNTAMAGSDYVALSQTGVTIAAGQTSKTVSVTINGDTTVEPDEAFIFNIRNAVGANITVGSVWGNILNDDGGSTPNMWVSDMSITEGNSGTKTLNYVVNLSAASSGAVTFDAATSNNTAMAGSDYVAFSQSGVSIPAGQTSKTVSVTINGDTTVEPNEAFIFNIFNAHGAYITVGSVWGNILNDD